MARFESESGVRRSPWERRGQARVPFAAPALVDSRRAWEACSCRDLSASGLAVFSQHAGQVGDTLDVYFELPSGMAVEVRAEVVRRDRSGALCMRFLELSGMHREALDFFVRAQQFSSAHIRVG